MASKVGAKTKGYIKNLDTREIKKFQYNPETFGYSRGATYVEITAPGMPYPDTQFVRGNARLFSVELFMFDKPSTQKINSYKAFLEKLLPPESNNVPKFTKPPMMLFVYGDFIKKCVLEDLAINIEEYDTKGEPTMARFTLSLRQVSA